MAGVVRPSGPAALATVKAKPVKEDRPKPRQPREVRQTATIRCLEVDVTGKGGPVGGQPSSLH